MANLASKFAKHIHRNWVQNDHSLEEISCVYAILAYDFYSKEISIAYIGSTTRLKSRYRSHKVPKKVQDMNKINILYYIPMATGFYDYEIKLIKKLQPIFNYQHKKKWH